MQQQIAPAEGTPITADLTYIKPEIAEKLIIQCVGNSNNGEGMTEQQIIDFLKACERPYIEIEMMEMVMAGNLTVSWDIEKQEVMYAMAHAKGEPNPHYTKKN